MTKRTKRFVDGGTASSGIQSAFDQPRGGTSGIGLGNNAPLVQIGSDTGTGVGGVQTSPQAFGPLNIGQPVQQPQQMRVGMAAPSAARPKARCGEILTRHGGYQ